MRQFYTTTIPPHSTTSIRTTFEKPVRKLVIVATASMYIQIDFAGGLSQRFFIPANVPVYLDFQSANNGGGIPYLFANVTADNENSCLVTSSVTEYGTGGDVTWYL